MGSLHFDNEKEYFEIINKYQNQEYIFPLDILPYLTSKDNLQNSKESKKLEKEIERKKHREK
jgi:hypothetical protein